MDLKKSPKALLKDLSKVLLDSSKALEAARKRDCETESGSSDCEEGELSSNHCATFLIIVCIDCINQKSFCFMSVAMLFQFC